jgi:endonuclease YncB( thermonuclease family)
MRWFLLALALAVHGASGETISGRVIGIADGDTLTILDAGKRQHKIRLAEIDAPERKQPFGTRSRQSLAALCFEKAAFVNDQGKDRYGRTIGRVNCAGVDANAEQVRQGMAWVFDRYVTDRALYSLQREAKAARRGLWISDTPIPPWQWRDAARGERLRKAVN